jgi:hypothetical protein
MSRIALTRGLCKTSKNCMRKQKYPFYRRFNDTLTLLVAFVTTSCGSVVDPMVGSWRLESAICAGETARLSGIAIPSTSYAFRTTYNSDNTFIATLDISGCPAITYAGTYSRDGLDVTETTTSVNCSTGCRFVAECVGMTGTIQSSATHSFFVTIPSRDKFQQTRHNPSKFCADGATEAQVYTRETED